MRIIETDQLTPEDLKGDRGLWIYNGLDVCVTSEVLGALLPQLTPTTAATYSFSRQLLGPILEMNMRGVLVDRERRDEVLASYHEDVDRLTNQLNRLIREGIGFDFTVSKGRKYTFPSDDQLKELFFDILGLPEITKVNDKGERVRTVDRKALEKLEHYFYAEPIVKHLFLLRELAKKISFLNTSCDPDGRMRTSFNIAGTTTGRLSSAMSDTGTGCVRPTAEALTPTGWKTLAEIKSGDYIAQWDGGFINFVRCTMNRKNFSGQLLQMRSEQISLTVTQDHRVIGSDYRNPIAKIYKALDASTLSVLKIPLGGCYEEGQEYIPPFAAMLMAGFSKEGSGWRGAFTKQRKIDRFLALTKEFSLSFNEQKAPEGYRRFYLPGYLDIPKKWGAWVLNLSQEAAYDLIEEARYWDSHSRGNSFIFYTAHKEQAEWFQILAHLTNHSTTLRKLPQASPQAYGGGKSIIWSVNVKPRTHAQVMKKHWKSVNYEGEVCCPSVPSTCWLVREDDYISVTGNSNLQNVTNRLRSIFIADPGYKFCNIDLEQGDSRGVGAIHWNLFRDPAYLDATESGDLHTLVAMGAFPNLPWTSDLKENRKVAEKERFYRDLNYRDAAKRLGHGSNYRGNYQHMAKETHIPPSNVKEFQYNYFKRFPSFKYWWEYVESQVRDTRKLTTLMGRQRYFFGDWREDSTINAAIAYEPQSITADTIDRGLLAVWRANRVQLLLQVHDSILFQFPEEQEDEIVPWALETIQQKLILKQGREFVIPGEAKVGWSWTDMREDPDGLRKYTDSNRPKKRTREVRLRY